MHQIFLIGFRGAGKTTVGQQLAGQLQWTFADSDRYIERRSGQTIREIFAQKGESAFRDLETDALHALASSSTAHQIVALGGGAVLREENRQILKRGFVVWLRVAEETAVARIAADPATSEQRPSLTGGGLLLEVRELLQQRTPIYAECADFAIDTDQLSTDQICREIIARLSEQGVSNA